MANNRDSNSIRMGEDKMSQRRYGRLQKNHGAVCILFLCFCLFISGCVNFREPIEAEKTTFYTLEYDPPAPSHLQSLSAAIRVKRFGVAPTYDTKRIIYREGAFERDAYVYHRWRDNPGELVSFFLSRDMRESGLFEAVLSHHSRVPASHILEGRVDEFFESDARDGWEAVLSVSIVLTAVEQVEVGKRSLLQKSYQRRAPCRGRTPKALAEAMSHAMSEVSSEITRETYSFLKQNRDETSQNH
ncbi:MAG: membrane integrity-associated transporter subunit PqiC [Deltaproteobacteria bacterium]|nr:membrane integrity-associated transporter subunit PqiC [Deltaproteobacteria bacterium]